MQPCDELLPSQGQPAPVPRGVQPLEQLVQQHHLAAGHHQAGGHVVVAARTQTVLLLNQSSGPAIETQCKGAAAAHAGDHIQGSQFSPCGSTR